MITRRNFINHACGLGVSAAPIVSSLLSLGAARQLSAQTLPDYKAMVCILLAGGNDSYNMVIPNDSDQYSQYSAIRSDLALKQQSLLPLAGATESGRHYALHPGMAQVQQLFDNGELAIMANVGTMVEAVDAQAVEAGTAKLPLGLLSHSDQIAQWQTALPGTRSTSGWGGRLADLFQGVNLANGISMNISLSGTNIFQSGVATGEYSIDSQGDGAIGIDEYNDGSEFGAFQKQIIDSMFAVKHTNLFRSEYSLRMRSSIEAQRVFVEALQSTNLPTTTFSQNKLSQSLRQISRVIAARETLGVSRQTFFITVGGWDHHDELLDNQAALLPLLSTGLSEFRHALVELGVFQDVTTFTISDFARTLTSNGRGSDHGWGGHQLMMGGSVNGQRLYGSYPILAKNSPLDIGRGIYIPTTSVDLYFAELALWFGVSQADLPMILPNIGKFYAGGNSAPLGFMV